MNSAHWRKNWESIEGEGGRLLTSESAANRRDMDLEARNVRIFGKLFTLAQILGIIIIGLMVVWLRVFNGGFAWHSNPALEFNWHPLLMVIGLIFLYANGALVYRAFKNEMKKKLKVIHACFHFLVLVLTIVGLQAAFDSHNLKEPVPIPNLYSLHSWVGLVVVILFACQWVMGLVTFLFPGLRPGIRSTYLPMHQFFGVSIFVGAVAAALLGLTEKAMFSMGSAEYSMKSPQGILINSIGICLVLFCALVIYLAANSSYKRRATEDEILLTDTVLD